MQIAFSAVIEVFTDDRTYRVDLLSETVEQCIRLPYGRGVTWRKIPRNSARASNAILRASDLWHAENPGKRLATPAELRARGLAAYTRKRDGIE